MYWMISYLDNLHVVLNSSVEVVRVVGYLQQNLLLDLGVHLIVYIVDLRMMRLQFLVDLAQESGVLSGP